MAERIAEIVVLVEDRNHENFVHRYLKRLGRKIRNIRVEKAPPGRGAGEQWVRDEWSRINAAVPDHCVDSLRQGLVEIRRIP